MKKCILLAISILLTSLICAQNQETIITGPVERISDKNSFVEIVGLSSNSLIHVTYNNKKRTYSIVKRDENLEIDQELEIDFKVDNQKIHFHKALLLDNKLSIIYSVANENHAYKLFKQSIDIKTLSLLDRSMITHSEHLKEMGKTGIKLSQDSTQILLFYEGETQNNLGLIVFDNDYKLVWKKEVRLPYPKGLFRLKNIYIDNNSNVLIHSKIFKNSLRLYSDKKINFYHKIFAITNKGQKEMDLDVVLDNKFILDMNIGVFNNEIICAGYESGISSYPNAVTFMLKINLETGKNILSKRHMRKNLYRANIPPLPKRGNTFILTNNPNEKEEIYSFKISDLIFDKYGNFQFIGEFFFGHYPNITHSMGANGSSSYYKTISYSYVDIDLLFFRNDGSCTANSNIIKHQMSNRNKTQFSSYCYAAKGNRYFIFYNELTDNLHLAKNGDGYKSGYSMLNKGELAIAYYKPGEKAIIKAALDKRRTLNISDTRYCKQLTPDKMCLYLSTYSKQQLVIYPLKFNQ